MVLGSDLGDDSASVAELRDLARGDELALERAIRASLAQPVSLAARHRAIELLARAAGRRWARPAGRGRWCTGPSAIACHRGVGSSRWRLTVGLGVEVGVGDRVEEHLLAERRTAALLSRNLLAAGTLTLLVGRRSPRPRPPGMSGAAVGHTAPYSRWRASSPNRNDNSTKRRPAVTSRTSCRCEQLNSSAAPAAGRYSSGPYSGKRS
jgi:hypothetical protein